MRNVRQRAASVADSSGAPEVLVVDEAHDAAAHAPPRSSARRRRRRCLALAATLAVATLVAPVALWWQCRTRAVRPASAREHRSVKHLVRVECELGLEDARWDPGAARLLLVANLSSGRVARGAAGPFSHVARVAREVRATERFALRQASELLVAGALVHAGVGLDETFARACGPTRCGVPLAFAERFLGDVTVQELLGHRAGLPDVLRDDLLYNVSLGGRTWELNPLLHDMLARGATARSPTELLQFVADEGYRTRPRRVRHAATTGYVVLGLLLEFRARTTASRAIARFLDEVVDTAAARRCALRYEQGRARLPEDELPSTYRLWGRDVLWDDVRQDDELQGARLFTADFRRSATVGEAAACTLDGLADVLVAVVEHRPPLLPYALLADGAHRVGVRGDTGTVAVYEPWTQMLAVGTANSAIADAALIHDRLVDPTLRACLRAP